MSSPRLQVRRLVELVHDSPKMAVIATAGAGGQALAWLLGTPGASKTVLEAVVPYNESAMAEFLGRRPARYVSGATAKEMAQSAYKKALRLRNSHIPVVGLACTASIATVRPKRGAHCCYVAAWDQTGVTSYRLKLTKGARDRSAEEDVVSRLILRALADSCGVEQEIPLGLLDDERLEVNRVVHGGLIRRLIEAATVRGHGDGLQSVIVYPDGEMAENEPVGTAVLPGSFNPLHSGHEKLAQVASEMLGDRVVFEISVVNVDKPHLEEAEVWRRLRQFHGEWSVVLTRAPTFREKAVLFRGSTFVIGWDTLVRLLEASYYGRQEADVHAALEEIRRSGCRFLVAGRMNSGAFRTLADVAINEEFAELFEAIPESRFRADIASTELRSSGSAS